MNLNHTYRPSGGYTCLFSSGTSNSRGVSILLNNTFKHGIHRVKTNISGNYIIINITIEGERITIANIYGPNRDQPIFFLNILDYIEDFGNEKYILCGDFNLVLTQKLYTHKYLHVNHPKSQAKLIDNMNAFDLRDPFRELYPNLKRYIWRKRNPFKQARLDYFLVSNNIMSFVENVVIQNSYRSNHAWVILTISLSQIKTGRGLWKVNNSLLTDKQYVHTVKEIIKK